MSTSLGEVTAARASVDTRFVIGTAFTVAASLGGMKRSPEDIWRVVRACNSTKAQTVRSYLGRLLCLHRHLPVCSIEEYFQQGFILIERVVAIQHHDEERKADGNVKYVLNL